MEQIVQLSLLFLYFILMFVIGGLASRKIKDLRDFFVGGKKLRYWVVAFSARATGESAWLLLGLTGMGAAVGMKAMWVVVGEILGVSIAWILMSHRFKSLTDHYDSITVPDYLESRVKDTSHLIRIIAAVALVVFPTIYVSAQLDATGKAFHSFLGWNYYVGLIVGFAVVLSYIVVGGFVAVAWTDLVQGILMLGGLVLLPLGGIYYLGGLMEGWSVLWNSLSSMPGDLLHPLGAEGWELSNLMGIISLLLIGVGYLGSPQIFVRYISLRDKKELTKGTWVAILWTLFADTGAVLAGMAGRVIFSAPIAQKGITDVLGNGGENVLPMMSAQVFPLVISSLYLIVVLAAIMSTLDSLLILASSALVRDFYQKIFHPQMPDEQMTRLCRIYTFALSTFAFAIALSVALVHPQRTIFWFVIFGWSGIAATFCPVMVLSLFWKGLTKAGMAAGMVTGFLGVIIFKFWPAWIDLLGYEPNVVGKYLLALEELPPSVFMAMIMAVLVSFLTQTPEGVEKDFENC